MSDDYFSEIFHLGNLPFVFFGSPDGGRIIPAGHIKSIVPDFRGSGSMIFLSNTEKAIKIHQSPEEILNDLLPDAESPTPTTKTG